MVTLPNESFVASSRIRIIRSSSAIEVDMSGGAHGGTGWAAGVTAPVVTTGDGGGTVPNVPTGAGGAGGGDGG